MRNKQIFKLIEEGETYEGVGNLYEISKQRVGQIYRQELGRRGIDKTYDERRAKRTETLSTLVTEETKEKVLEKISNVSEWLRELVKGELEK